MIQLHLIRDNGRFEPVVSSAPVAAYAVHVGRDIAGDEDVQKLPEALARHGRKGIVLPLPGNHARTPDAPEVLLIVDNGTLPEILAPAGVEVTLYDVGSDIYDDREEIEKLPAFLADYGSRGIVIRPHLTLSGGRVFE